jgi:hypothetical protein
MNLFDLFAHCEFFLCDFFLKFKHKGHKGYHKDHKENLKQITQFSVLNQFDLWALCGIFLCDLCVRYLNTKVTKDFTKTTKKYQTK